jgi:fumarate reductase flavoprotein subunit
LPGKTLLNLPQVTEIEGVFVMKTAEKSTNRQLKADLVVIGGGGAGLIAAVSAAERGVENIIVLEAREVAGGNSVFAVSMFNFGSPNQNKEIIQEQGDQLFKKVMDFTHWNTSGRVTRVLINKSTDTIQWMEKQGVKFDPPSYARTGQESPFFLTPPGADRIGAYIARTMVKRCSELSIEILYQTRAKKLITNNAGRITGVVAEKDGLEIRITSKCVIISTGGIIGNKRLMKKYLPTYQPTDDIYIGGLNHKGEGMQMATAVGAATESRVSVETSVNRAPWSAVLFLFVKHPKTLWLNKKGERYCDESARESFNGQFRQVGKTAYILMDEKIKQSIYAEELTSIDRFVLASDMTLDVIDKNIQEAIRKKDLFAGGKNWVDVAEKDLPWQAKNGKAKISNSLTDIAKWMGADPQELQATIDEYNDGCDKGYDEVFAKDKKFLLPVRTPPYYAVRCYINALVTHGGIKVSHKMQVLDKEDNSITGLYAAGVEAASADYDTYGPVPAHGYGFAVNSGRIAGESAADFLK